MQEGRRDTGMQCWFYHSCKNKTFVIAVCRKLSDHTLGAIFNSISINSSFLRRATSKTDPLDNSTCPPSPLIYFFTKTRFINEALWILKNPLPCKRSSKSFELVKEIFIEGGSTAAAILEEIKIKQLSPVNELQRGVVRMKANDLLITVKPGSYELPEEIKRLFTI